MPDGYERGAIAVVGDRLAGAPELAARLSQLGPDLDGAPAPVVEVAADRLTELLADRTLAAVVIDVSGDAEGWTQRRAQLDAVPSRGPGNDVPFLLVAAEPDWDRVLDVLRAGRGDGVR